MIMTREVDRTDYEDAGFICGTDCLLPTRSSLSEPVYFHIIRKCILVDEVRLAGFMFNRDPYGLLEGMEEGDKLEFVREPDNPYDPMAIRVLDGKGRKIGYVPRRVNLVIANLMDYGKTVYGVVRRIVPYDDEPDVVIGIVMVE